MNKKGIFVPTLVILSLMLFVYLNFYLNPMFSTDYNFKFIDVLGNELELKEEMFDNEQAIKYNAYEALDILFKNGVCEDWYNCDPTQIYEEEFRRIFNENLDREYNVVLSFSDGVMLNANKDIEIQRGNTKIKTKHVFNNKIDFNWNIIYQLYEECREVKNCDELGRCKAICQEDKSFLNFEYPIDLEFVKTIRFKVSKRGELF